MKKKIVMLILISVSLLSLISCNSKKDPFVEHGVIGGDEVIVSTPVPTRNPSEVPEYEESTLYEQDTMKVKYLNIEKYKSPKDAGLAKGDFAEYSFVPITGELMIGDIIHSDGTLEDGFVLVLLEVEITNINAAGIEEEDELYMSFGLVDKYKTSDNNENVPYYEFSYSDINLEGDKGSRFLLKKGETKKAKIGFIINDDKKLLENCIISTGIGTDTPSYFKVDNAKLLKGSVK